MKSKNISPIVTKRTTFPVGTEFTLSYDKNQRSTIVTATTADGGGRVLLPCTKMHKYFKGFQKEPSMRSLEKMNDNASATTITGKRNVECDGVGADGFPAWPLALGYL